jgi:putative ABC transport system permease protein
MRTPIAWFNSMEQPRRTAAAVGGMCFALLLIFMQAGFLGAARRNVSVIYSAMDFDLVIHSRAYLTLPRSDPFDRMRLNQAASVPGVARVTRFMTDSYSWRNAATGSAAGGFMIGVPVDEPVFVDPAINAQLSALRPTLTMLVDVKSRPSYGPWKVSDKAVINNQPTLITGSYELGMGLIADGSVIVNNETYERLQGPKTSRQANLGLVKVAPGADIADVEAALKKRLPNDVVIATKAEIMAREQHYFISVKPVGIMFQVGMVVAFAAGAAILYQILASEMNNRLGEFATLKALGYPSSSIYSVGVQQGLIYALLAYGPALALACLIYQVARRLSGFPLYMDAARACFVLVLALAMCGFAAVLSLWKIRTADPAALF